MAGNILQWNGDAAMDHVRRQAVRWLVSAAKAVKGRAKELLSVPGTVQSIGGKGNRRKKGARITGAVRSAPGEPPRKQYGTLRESVDYEVDPNALTARIGTPLLKGLWLELGTKRGLAPRPWLRRALAESADKINSTQIGGD